MARARIRRTILITAVGSMMGCARGSREHPAAEVVDSAGTRFVTYDLTASEPPRFHRVGEADLEIGMQDGPPEYAFSRIVDLAVAADGSIVVSDAMSHQLRVFRQDGTYKASLGQRGEAPGEFVDVPTIAGLAADTVVAFDRSAARVTAFTMDGNLAWAKTVGSPGADGPTAILREDDGILLARFPWVSVAGSVSTPHDARLELDSIAVLRLDADGMLVDTVHVMADRHRLRVVQHREGGRLSVMQTVTPYAAQAFVRSDGRLPLVARSDSFSYARLSSSGRTELVVSVRGAENPATAGEIRSHQEERLTSALGDGPIDPVLRSINLDYLPNRLPSFGDILVSAEGDVWVSEMEYDSSDGYDWLVFAPSGQLKGDVRTPPGVRVFAVRGDQIYGVASDSLDVQYVRRYPLLDVQLDSTTS